MEERATIVVIGEFRLGFRFDSGSFRFFGEFLFGRSLARGRWLGCISDGVIDAVFYSLVHVRSFEDGEYTPKSKKSPNSLVPFPETL